MLDNALTTQLKTYLEMVREPIVLVPSPYRGDDAAKSSKSAHMDELLSEIAALSDKVSVGKPVDNERTPSFAITRPGSPIDIRFAGLPMGHEFTSLVLALLQVGGHPVKEEQSLIDAVRAVKGEHHFVTYMSLTCQNCPTVVQDLNAMAVLNPNIHHTAVDGGTHTDEVEAKGIASVPAIYLDGEDWGSGRMDMAEILERLDADAAQGAKEDLSQRDPYDVLVVGVALRDTTGPRLADALRSHVNDYNIDVIERQTASAIETTGGMTTVHLTDGDLRARSVIVATGARWRNLGVPGEKEYRTKGVTYCPHCDGPLFTGKKVAVVGGGNSGIEAAIDLAGVVDHVTVVEFLDALKADDVLLRTLNSLPNVDVITSARTTQILGDGSKVTGLEYEDRTSGDVKTIELAGVFVQIGLLPNTEWLEGALERNQRGEIVIDERGTTSAPGIFAAGDCTTQPYKQIIISMGAGATAALGAFDHLIRQNPTQN